MEKDFGTLPKGDDTSTMDLRNCFKCSGSLTRGRDNRFNDIRSWYNSVKKTMRLFGTNENETCKGVLQERWVMYE